MFLVSGVLPDAVGSEEDEVSTLAYEVESQRAFNQGPIDFLGPVPVEVGNRLEGAEPAVDAAPFEGSSGAVGSFGAQDFLEECSGSEPILGGPGERIDEEPAVARRPRACNWAARSLILGVLRCGLGEQIVGAQGVSRDVEPLERGGR